MALDGARVPCTNGCIFSLAWAGVIELYLQEKERKRKRKEASKSKSKKHKHKKVPSSTFSIICLHNFTSVCSLECITFPCMLASTQPQRHLANILSLGFRTRRAEIRSTAARSDEGKAVVLTEPNSV